MYILPFYLVEERGRVCEHGGTWSAPALLGESGRRQKVRR